MKTAVNRKVRLDKIFWVEDSKHGKIMPIVLGKNKTSYLDILSGKVYNNIEFDEEDNRLDLVEDALYTNLELTPNEMILNETSTMLGRECIARAQNLQNSPSETFKKFYAKMYLLSYAYKSFTLGTDDELSIPISSKISQFCETNYATKSDILKMQKYFQDQMNIKLNKSTELEN